MEYFLEFVDRKQRESKKHLKLVEKALKKSGFEVASFIDEEDSHIFVKGDVKEIPFEGIRIYEIGDSLAYRAQKEKETEPYGKAYGINLEEMFNDFMGENIEEEKAGLEVIKGLAEEIKEFFTKSAKAQSEVEGREEEKPVIVKTGGTDYSGMVVSKM